MTVCPSVCPSQRYSRFIHISTIYSNNYYECILGYVHSLHCHTLEFVRLYVFTLFCIKWEYINNNNNTIYAPIWTMIVHVIWVLYQYEKMSSSEKYYCPNLSTLWLSGSRHAVRFFYTKLLQKASFFHFRKIQDFSG